MIVPDWSQRSIKDLAGIITYIRAENQSAADKLFAKIYEIVYQKLATQPLMGKSGRSIGTREIVIHSSYILVYRTDGKVIEILAIRHTSRIWPRKF